jgi:hypothetical protein
MQINIVCTNIHDADMVWLGLLVLYCKEQPKNELYAIFDTHLYAKLCDYQNYRLTVKKSINLL